jgi:hypothetical protein
MRMPPPRNEGAALGADKRGSLPERLSCEGAVIPRSPARSGGTCLTKLGESLTETGRDGQAVEGGANGVGKIWLPRSGGHCRRFRSILLPTAAPNQTCSPPSYLRFPAGRMVGAILGQSPV